MQRIHNISQKRKGIELPTLFGDYEFSVVPRSLFCHDGTLLPCNDKYKVLHFIEDLIPKNKEMLVNNLPTVENEEFAKTQLSILKH